MSDTNLSRITWHVPHRICPLLDSETIEDNTIVLDRCFASAFGTTPGSLTDTLTVPSNTNSDLCQLPLVYCILSSIAMHVAMPLHCFHVPSFRQHFL
jgi:hypothetical protein